MIDQLRFIHPKIGRNRLATDTNMLVTELCPNADPEVLNPETHKFLIVAIEYLGRKERRLSTKWLK